MKINVLSVLLGLLAHSVVSKPAPHPQITPAPLVKRDQAFIGFYSTVFGTSTGWTANSCLAGYTTTASGNFWRCCQSGSICQYDTGCSGTYILAPGTAIDCNIVADAVAAETFGSIPVTNAVCTSDVQYASVGATSAAVYYHCGPQGDIGTDYYLATTSSSITPPTTPTVSPTPPPTPTPTPPPAKKSNTGAIAGGVVGGLVVITAAAAAIFFFCARSRKQTAAEPVTAPVADQGLTYTKNESESMSPYSQLSGWGSASPATLNDTTFRHPDARMSPPPMSGSPAMYMPQPVNQVPMQQMPMQQMPMQQVPVQQYPGHEAYHQPNGGAMELASNN